MNAPDFKLPDQDGISHSLPDYRGKWLVLYFYPKDDTPGCTTEACAFRDGRDQLAALGAEVVGVSRDSVSSHLKFADKHGLNFTLLSDETGNVIRSYGAQSPQGTMRRTVLIAPDGAIAKEYPAVTPASHAGQVIADLTELSDKHNE